MVFEIRANKLGKPYLKAVDRKRRNGEPRGQWMAIGRVTDTGIERVVRMNREAGLIVLVDDTGIFRALVLTD